MAQTAVCLQALKCMEKDREQPLRPMALLNRLTPNIGMALRRLSSAEPSSKKVAA